MASTPLSGPMKYCPVASTKDRPPRRPDSWIHNHHMDRLLQENSDTPGKSERPPSEISNGCTSWLMSTIRASGQMPKMTPFMTPTKWSLVPKSVVKRNDRVSHARLLN